MSQIRFSPEKIRWVVAQMVSSTRGEVFLVNVNWNVDNQRWNVNMWNLTNEWNAGYQFFSRNSKISPTLNAREFLQVGLFSSRQSFDRAHGFVLKAECISYRRARATPMPPVEEILRCLFSEPRLQLWGVSSLDFDNLR